MTRELSSAAFAELLASPFAYEALAGDAEGGAVLVDAREDALAVSSDAIARVAAVPCVLVGLVPSPGGSVAMSQGGGEAAPFDIAVGDRGEADVVLAAVEAHPVAATALALLLRGGERRSIEEGLVAESTTYSALQAGPEHLGWLATRPTRPRAADTAPPVRVAREGDVLRITLTRPHVRNAFNTAVRDALIDACAVAAADRTITEVVLDGDGPAFCSGGDLTEFGTVTDPAHGHLVRVARSAGRALAAIADRVTARVHGSCIGAGVELSAFAHRVLAAPDATFALPEVGMGLVPGAGGTVSVPRRIGRQRAAWLAITGTTIDATTALEWGLVDAIER